MDHVDFELGNCGAVIVWDVFNTFLFSHYCNYYYHSNGVIS